MTTGPTGARPGRCFPARSPTSGTARCMRPRWPRAWRPAASPSASQIIWAKERLVLSRGDYHWQHEPCWYAVREKGKGHWSGDRKQTTLWQIPNRDQDAADGARHPEAGRVHAPADAQQLQPRPGGLRAVLAARAPRSSPPRPAAGSASRWSSTRPMSMSRCCAGRRSPARPRRSMATAAASPRSPPSDGCGP